MNIIIPLGGVGKRFSDYGYTKPKPLIKVLGKEIIFWLLDSLDIKENDSIYIPYNESLDIYSFSEIVKDLYPLTNLVSLPTTKGPAETLKKCISHFKIKGKIVILDGDTWYEENILEKVRNNNNNLTTYFKSQIEEPLFSYVDLEKDRIIDIKEKIKISDNANSGCYVFNDAKQVCTYINKIEKKSERFVSDIISKMIEDQVFFSSLLVEKFHVLGTPQQIIEFAKLYPSDPKRFVFDLDNTLVTFPQIKGDYSTVKPIEKTINYLRKLKMAGHYIIIYTARRMRTHNGDVKAVINEIREITVEKLKEFNIPYDELIFGKPYANFYIDDLMINPKTDLNKEIGFYMENVVPRHFNKLIFEDDYVIKISNDKKLEGESFYYKKINKYPIRRYFPKLIKSEKGKIIMEKINGSNFSTLFINESLTIDAFEKLLNVTSQIHKQEQINKTISNYYDYSDKLIKRFNEFDFDNYGINKAKRLNIINSVKDLKVNLSIIHGDLVFSNIILSNEGDIKLVDVKGRQGDTLTIYGDPYYDYAKIYQSLAGYDEILLDKTISISYKRKIMEYFENYLNRKNIKIDIIRKISASLLVSLVPLHNEPEKYQKYIDLSNKLFNVNDKST